MRVRADKAKRKENAERALLANRNAKQRARLRERGMSVSEYDRMVAAQNGVCAICRRQSRSVRCGKVLRLSVDHDHVTGRVRGLICNRCNMGLGNFDDEPAFLRAAAAYLELASGLA
jgi:Recombination endonuclease VII